MPRFILTINEKSRNPPIAPTTIPPRGITPLGVKDFPCPRPLRGLDKKGTRYSHEKIIGILEAHEAGAELADLVREHGISEQSFCRWQARHGGMEVGDASRLKELEVENARLKRLLAKAELDKAALKDVLSKKWCGRRTASGSSAIYVNIMG